MEYKEIEQKLAIAMMQHSYIFEKAARKIGLKKFMPYVSFLRKISKAKRLCLMPGVSWAGRKNNWRY